MMASYVIKNKIKDYEKFVNSQMKAMSTAIN